MKKNDFSRIKLIPQAERIRTFPQMYLGREYDEEGFYSLLLAIAEFTLAPKHANNNSYLEISILDSSSVILADHGRGLPMDEVVITPSLSGPKLELVLTKHWRNKFDDEYYQEFGFLDYMGLVLCAVSSDLKVETHFERRSYSIRCSKGQITESLKEVDCQGIQIGTRIEITPDRELFGDWPFMQEYFATLVDTLSSKYPEAKILFKKGRN